jgi:hypothetical protein
MHALLPPALNKVELTSSEHVTTMAAGTQEAEKNTWTSDRRTNNYGTIAA